MLILLTLSPKNWMKCLHHHARPNQNFTRHRTSVFTRENCKCPCTSFTNKLLSSMCPLLKCTKKTLLKNQDGGCRDKLKPHIFVNSKEKIACC